MRDNVPSARYYRVCNVLRQWSTYIMESIDFTIYVWVWLVGVVSRMRVWLVGVGGIYGCG